MPPWLKRLNILISSPIWIPLGIVALVLWFICAALFWIVGGLGYWIVTGEDITRTKYNIFDI